MSDMTLKKLFIVTVFEFLNLRGNSMYVLPDNGLKVEISTYPLSTDSITQPDPSSIQLSTL